MKIGKYRKLILEYAQLVTGCFLGGLAYPLFMTPNNIAPGGLTGVATILHHLFGWPIGMVSLLLNIPLFLLGFKEISGRFVLRSLIAMGLFSLFIDILPFGAMTMDPLLGTLFGGILLGVGLGLILRSGATTGGTDMMAKLLHRKIQFLSVGAILFGLDCIVIMAAGIFIGANEALYALINIYVSSKIIDYVIIGITANKACYVMSDSWDVISRRILHEMERGATLLRAKGAWSGQERPVIMSVISRTELPQLKQIVMEEDEAAFMIVTDAIEATGEGFSSFTDPA
ncbi:MAG: YitT family protein [Clostridia bacterium]|nr:YitT family protein [Clostridia bacterium]